MATGAFSPKTIPYVGPTFWDYGNRTTMPLLLSNNEEATLAKLLVVGLSIGSAKRVGERCIGQPEDLRNDFFYLKCHFNLIVIYFLISNNCLFRFSYLLEGNLQQYFTSKYCFYHMCRLH